MMKILISDIDCTMNRNENLDLFNAINKFVKKGNIFIIATDKAINYVADLLVLQNLNVEYFLCNDGAVIFDRYFNILYRKDLKETVVRPIVNILEDDDNILETFIDTSHGFVKEYRGSANGIVARPLDKVEAEITLNNICMKYPEVNGCVNDNWLNIYDKSVNKYTSLKYLIDNYRLKDYEIYSLCTSVGDLELVKNTNGYVLKDSAEDLKAYSKGEFNNLKELVDFIDKDEEETIYLDI